MAFSRATTRRCTVEELTPRERAAAFMLPVRATAKKCRRSFQSNIVPSHFRGACRQACASRAANANDTTHDTEEFEGGTYAAGDDDSPPCSARDGSHDIRGWGNRTA